MNPPAAAAAVYHAERHTVPDLHAAAGDTQGSLAIAAALLPSCIDRCERAAVQLDAPDDRADQLREAQRIITEVLASLIA